jgi:hypothetical protein
MFEVWALLILLGGSYGLGRWQGRRAAEDQFMGVHVGAGKGSKCHFCGVLVDTRFYCKPPKAAR